MKKPNKRSDFYADLQRRLEENKKLYKKQSVFTALNSPLMRFVASHLGVNPWKIMIPISFLISIFFRAMFGRAYFELVLRVLGGP